MKIDVDEDVLRTVFDLVVNSLDFGSDFFDEEDTVALRALAVALGVDPIDATPSTHQCKYLGEHVPATYPGGAYPPGEYCTRCHKAMAKPVGFKVCEACKGGSKRPGWDAEKRCYPECPVCNNKGYVIERPG